MENFCRAVLRVFYTGFLYINIPLLTFCLVFFFLEKLTYINVCMINLPCALTRNSCPDWFEESGLWTGLDYHGRAILNLSPILTKL